MDVKALFHVDDDNDKTMHLALNNIANLLAQIPAEQAEVVLVANGPAARLMVKTSSFQTVEMVRGLAEKNVRFMVCANSIKNAGIDPATLIEGCVVVPAGIVELVRLQAEGYAYIKP